MAIVPTFQGGVPQVRDTGGSGFTPARAPVQNVDAYGRMMQQAMKPVEDWSKSLTEALRIQHQRTVKAESDDAEGQVIDIINQHMNGENGYLTQQGKNALDAFRPTMEAMTADVDKVVGALQPQVREVIGSRIRDRLSSAMNQAERWHGQQTRAYHMTSSEARVQTLMADADNHYAETPYLQKTWGSIATEIDYQASMMGLPAEQVKVIKDKNYDLFQSRRFEAWGTDNPVQALQVFRSQKPKVSKDIAARIESGLYSKSRDLLALGLAGAPVAYDEEGKIKNLAWMDDPKAQTGDPFIDSLRGDQRLNVVLRARQLRSQMIQARSDEFKRETQNNLAETLLGNNPEPLSRDQFIEAYGPKTGDKEFNQYQLDRTENQFRSDVRFMSDADIAQQLKAAKPKSGDEDYASAAKTWQAMTKAADTVRKERQTDKIGFALENGYAGYQPVTWSNPQQVRTQLGYRAQEMTALTERWGGDAQLFSKQEASDLVKTLDDASVNDRVALLRTIADAVGNEGILAMTRQLKEGASNYAIAASAINVFPDNGAISLGEMYMRGKDAVAQNRVKLDDAAVVGIRAQVNNALGEEGGVEPVYEESNVIKATEELVKGIAGYTLLTSGSVSSAIETAIGQIENHNGKKIVMPKGYDGFWGEDLDDYLLKESDNIKKGGGSYYVGGVAYSAEQLARELPKLKLQTYARLPGGGVSYVVLRNGSIVMNAKTNQALVLEVFGK